MQDNLRNYYWATKKERSSQAKYHTDVMKRTFHKSIDQSVHNTKLYEYGTFSFIPIRDVGPDMIVDPILMKSTTEDAIIEVSSVPDAFGVVKRIAALNFASFKHPRGAFLYGSRAQEESLCHKSFLYNVLSEFEESFYSVNRKRLNRGVYDDRALYSPGVLFFNSHFNMSYPCDVITCAAPNYNTAIRCGIPREKILNALENRINFIFHIVADINYLNKDHPITHLILGAFGCGVFGNDPDIVSDIFRKVSNDWNDRCLCQGVPFPTLIYAIPELDSTDNVYNMFERRLFHNENRELYRALQISEILKQKVTGKEADL